MTIDERMQKIITELLDAGVPLKQAKEAFEQKYITIAKRMRSGNITKAAKLLGVHRNTVMSKMPSERAMLRRGWSRWR